MAEFSDAQPLNWMRQSPVAVPQAASAEAERHGRQISPEPAPFRIHVVQNQTVNQGGQTMAEGKVQLEIQYCVS